MRRRWAAVLSAIALVVLTACVAEPTPSPTPAATPSLTPTATPDANPGATPSATASGETATAEPTPSPEPTLGLDPPEASDERVVTVEVQPEVGADGGRLLVVVSSQASDRIDELVLRWPRELNGTLFLRPFVPSDERIVEGGPPLVQSWTKWVLGPGEEGEPAGTVSLGYGPLLAGATLTIPLDAVWRADGPVAFDLQVLAENSLLTLADGEPAELRVEVP